MTTDKELEEWYEKNKDDPDARAALRDLKEGESARQRPEQAGDSLVIPVNPISSYRDGEELGELTLLALGKVPWEQVNGSNVTERMQYLETVFAVALERMDRERAEIIRDVYFENKTIREATQASGGNWAHRKLRTALKEFVDVVVEVMKEADEA